MPTDNKRMMEFVVEPSGGGFRLMVKGYDGLKPIGPRLLRMAGVFDVNKYLRPHFPDERSAMEAKIAWTKYQNEVIWGKKKKKK